MKQTSIKVPNVILQLGSNSHNKLVDALFEYFYFEKKIFETVKDDFSDGVTRILRSTHWISGGGGNKPDERNKLIIRESHLRELTPSREDITAVNKIRKDGIEAVCFTFIQIQADVLVVIDYLEHWQDVVHKIKSELRNIFLYSELTPANLAVIRQGSPKAKKPNLQTIERATIWRHLSPWIKSLNVRPTAKDCLEKIKSFPAYKKKKITRQRMEKILSEGVSGVYDEITKRM